MENSLSKYRLRSNAFTRPEEDSPLNPKRIMFLSVEGAVTEVQYFEHLKASMSNSNSTVFLIEVLQRKRNDGHSSPEHVLELLDELMEVRDGELPKPWMIRLESKYSPKIIEDLIDKEA